MVFGRVWSRHLAKKFLRSFTIGLFLFGSVSLVGAACGGGDGDGSGEDLQVAATATQATVESTATTSPTNTATPTTPPTATPTPFNGNIARMKIPSIGVDHVIETVGLTPAGDQLDTPHNATGAIGWYSVADYPNLKKPGFDGSAMFSAHVNYNGANGPFANLANVKGGDKIIVSMDGGPEYTYEVFAVRGYVIDPAWATSARPVIDMGWLIDTPDRPAGEQWVSLITCSCGPGRIVGLDANGFGECVDRDVVLAKRVS